MIACRESATKIRTNLPWSAAPARLLGALGRCPHRERVQVVRPRTDEVETVAFAAPGLGVHTSTA